MAECAPWFNMSLCPETLCVCVSLVFISATIGNSLVLFLFSRFYSHINQTSSWLPPIDNWNGSIQAGASGGTSLPYGWEAATDREGKAYFIK